MTTPSPDHEPPSSQRSSSNPSTSDSNHPLPLRQNQPKAAPLLARLRTHLSHHLDTTHADLIMLTCSFISGLVDSTIYNAYGTFVSMQTGNTIFVGLGPSSSTSSSTTTTSSKGKYGWVKSLTSILCFCLGCFFFSRISLYSGPQRRLTLVTSFALQTAMIFLVSSLIQAGIVNGALDTLSTTSGKTRTTSKMWRDEVPISLLSFQAAGQIITSRALGVSEIPSVVLTSMLCDIASDPSLAAPLRANAKRNRRALAFVCILVGAIVGGYIARLTGKMQLVLWVAGGIKGVVTVAWGVWPEEKKRGGGGNMV